MRYLIVLIAITLNACTTPKQEQVIADVLSPAGINSEEPSFFTDEGGNVGLSWLKKDNEQSILKYAVYKKGSWSVAKTLVSGKDVLTNWADFPGVQTNGRHWIAWFLQKNVPDIFAYDVMIMQSSDEGEKWTTPQRLHSDSTLTDHGFVSAVPTENGFQLMWLDGRLATEDSPIFTVRTAHVNFDGKISNRKILDDNTCTCCQTTMLNTGDDNFVALYRNRTEKEIRDIGFVNFNNQDTLAEPKILFADEWYIPGCPVNGPRAKLNGKELGVAWFTMGKEGVAKVQFVTSNDNGNTYSTPLLIDKNNLGRVDVLATDGAYYVSFMDKLEDGAEIKIVKIKDTKIVKTFLVAKVASSRKTGFPRMALSKNGTGIYVVYTDGDSKKVVMKYQKI